MRRIGAPLVLSLMWSVIPLARAAGTELIDDFRDATRWQASASDQVKAALERGPRGGLCLRYDFGGVSGYAVARRALPLDLPPHYAFTLRLSGEGPANALQLKFVDASGDNVWWRNLPAYTPPAQPMDLRIRQREVEFAWGPTADKVLRQAAAIELVVASGEGGRGRLCFERLALHRLDPPGPPVEPRITHAPGATMLDLGRPTEFNGLSWRWAGAGGPGPHAARVEASDDGRRWRLLHTVRGSRRSHMALWLPEQEARYLRITSRTRAEALHAPSPADWPDRNALLRALAADAPRSAFPRAFHGQQNYWTLVGVDGGAAHSALMSEDGSIEPRPAGPSLEPVLIDAEGRLIGWAEVQRTNTLADDHLPLPTVQWRHPRVAMRIDAAADGPRQAPQLLLRYTVHNVYWERQHFTLALALRPWQVNPPQQFLNTPGGFAPVRQLAWNGSTLAVNGHPWLRTVQPPAEVRAAPGDEADALLDSAPPLRTLRDDTGFASARLAWPMTLEPGERRTVHVLLPASGAGLAPGPARDSTPGAPTTATATATAATAAAPAFTTFTARTARTQATSGATTRHDIDASPTPADIDARFDAIAAHWRQRLNRVRFTLPPAAKPLHDSLRSALAHMLLSRDGPALQPGTRSYARSWVRDGAMMVAGLLRLGEVDAARDFVRWYAGFLFADGKVPCCVDRRGADPVAENDSHGQFIHAVALLWRHAQDSVQDSEQGRALVAELWPKVDAAARHMEALRQSERKPGPPGFFGMMPASISHEGYSAKPMHSHWDNFWALAGWRDAVLLAEVSGHAERAAELKAQHDEFRRDLAASLAATMQHHRIPHLPGAAELGDFDPSSSTLIFSPAGAEDLVPRAVLDATWDRYWAEASTRRQRTDWPDYTPYELRSVSALLRLGHPGRARAMLDFFHADQRPAGWNQWAEVVGRVEREPRFIGDMPHAWISSDYIRSALDLLACERDSDGALVLAAGVPPEWLDAGPVGVEGLGTVHGRLSYQLKRAANGAVELSIGPGLRPPPGGLWLAWGHRLHRVPDGARDFSVPPP